MYCQNSVVGQTYIHTDRQTDRQTHETTTVTLSSSAHARQGFQYFYMAVRPGCWTPPLSTVWRVSNTRLDAAFCVYQSSMPNQRSVLVFTGPLSQPVFLLESSAFLVSFYQDQKTSSAAESSPQLQWIISMRYP